MYKCIIDTETTGLDYRTHGLHQVAAIVLDENDKEAGRIDLKFKPTKLVYSNQALEKTRLTAEELYDRKLTSQNAFSQFIEFLDEFVNCYDKKDKMQFMAYNTAFDEAFIRTWFEQSENVYFNSYFWAPTVCLQKTAAWHLRTIRPQFERFKLRTVCQFAQIDFNEDEAHDAMYDVERTVELYHKLAGV